MLPTFAEPVISPGYDKALSKDDTSGNFSPGSFINFCDSCPGNIHLGSTLLVSFLLQIYQTDDFIFIQSQSDSFRLSGTFFRRKRFILGCLADSITGIFSYRWSTSLVILADFGISVVLNISTLLLSHSFSGQNPAAVYHIHPLYAILPCASTKSNTYRSVLMRFLLYLICVFCCFLFIVFFHEHFKIPVS